MGALEGTQVKLFMFVGFEVAGAPYGPGDIIVSGAALLGDDDTGEGDVSSIMFVGFEVTGASEGPGEIIVAGAALLGDDDTGADDVGSITAAGFSMVELTA